ncbi:MULTISPECIES: DUF2147 domain-containing protein [unclassified Methylobacterium]|uniref:DUF2147 domain-containing protein n=1 Tax=unclassified Methylobacterium TaxID=2615210 RepID=UPI0006FA8607|nr:MULTISPECIES: DUF2147 domain-containing protein [unclassified Methylobacterium]KQP49024.1 hypothetical protein ASF39_14905 [Methylobacterium sp. Leaf108]KQT82697.1 hypothetical protein ASG59_18450 [Methylobacterium sp. Leaf466]
MTKRSTIDRAVRSTGPLAALALAMLPGAALAVPADPSGTWLTKDGRARIRVEKCGPQEKNICGYVVWLKVPLNDKGQPRVDFKNPDPKKQARPSLGHQLIMGLKPNADSRFEGKIYNSEEGKSYDVTIWTEERNELSIRGCMLAILCGSETWMRVNDVLPGQLTGPTNGPGGPRADAEWAPKAGPATASAPGVTTGTAKPAPKPAPKPAAAPAE